MQSTLQLLLLLVTQQGEPAAPPASRLELNDGFIRCVAISPDGRVVAGCGDRLVQLFDMQSGARIHRLEGHTKPVVSVAWSPNGKLLASAGEDRSVRLWDVDSAMTVRVIVNETRPRNPHPPRSVAFSPDGRTLVASYLMHADRTQIVLFDVASGRWTYDARQPRPEAPLHLAGASRRRQLAESVASVGFIDRVHQVGTSRSENDRFLADV